ncbi:Predicted arabinose efflux permease, MFS family [Dyadobacter soli]|uniref:Predicted arabinose efflux permease, MFS family n=1 Tax=Dyadobacter soli TaxID=659014 RepID=A0A1G7FU73_9BACT|nr:MFS transporter [Dyadobacter soli]SDE79332.1 Predicted arabinose efflux permease, MFS family [Dyadobacter soli]
MILNERGRFLANVFPLVAGQAFFQTAGILVAALSGLVGYNLAADKALATIPVAVISIGTAAALIPASMFMKKYGRKKGFMVGIGLGFLAGALASLGIYLVDFWLFVLGNMFVGAYQGFSQYYRFAAAESVPEAERSKAISWVVSGGVFAAVAGPSIARLTKDIGDIPFLYSYVSLMALSILAVLAVSRIRHDTRQDALAEPVQRERPLSEILKRPPFIGAIASSAVGSAVMVMVMTATPITMKICGYNADDSSVVIQWHVLGMFVPSFFTGDLIQRFGAVRVISCGILIFLLHLSLALSGTELFHFTTGLIFLGIGWNFMFIGGTALLTKSYATGDRAKSQAFHDFMVYAVATVSSFTAGAALDRWGWNVVNLIAAPMLVTALVVVQWYAFSERKSQVAQ